MPLFEFRCSAGHYTERLQGFSGAEVIACACGEPASRVEVNRIMFNMPGRQGEKYAHYHEAASEAQYQHDKTDDPVAKAATRPDIWRPALTRSRNAMQEAVIWGKDDRWADPNPGKSAKEVQHELS